MGFPFPLSPSFSLSHLFFFVMFNLLWYVSGVLRWYSHLCKGKPQYSISYISKASLLLSHDIMLIWMFLVRFPWFLGVLFYNNFHFSNRYGRWHKDKSDQTRNVRWGITLKVVKKLTIYFLPVGWLFSFLEEPPSVRLEAGTKCPKTNHPLGRL